MSYKNERYMKLVKDLNKPINDKEISDKEAEEAFIKILKSKHFQKIGSGLQL